MSDSALDQPVVQRVTASPCRGDEQLHHPMEKPVQHMAMYAALLGRLPTIDTHAPPPLEAATVAVKERPWSPLVLSVYLREVYRQSYKVARPELAAWIKKQSDVARKRLLETQTRIVNARNERAA